MSKFNFTQSSAIFNEAGGNAYKESPELKLTSLLLTSFAQDRFYQSEENTYQELDKLLTEVDPLFAAKAAVYARNEFGMRSITHILAVKLIQRIQMYKWAKYFYETVVRRPDDMSEILAFYWKGGKKSLPAAMKKGFAKAFDKFDDYQIAKYQQKQKDISLIDIVNLTHPKPTEKNKKSLELLVKGKLSSNDTWEAKLTKSGQIAESEEEKKVLKANAWRELITTRKIGYFALLRNLRNIIACDLKIDDKIASLLTDLVLIKKSLILPFRFKTAYDELLNSNCPQTILSAVNQAAELSLINVPEFPGNTLIAFDISGSMVGKPQQIGALFTAILAKRNPDADIIRFKEDANYLSINRDDSLLTLVDYIIPNGYGGTNFNTIFECSNKGYDRIIILSDMQGWMEDYRLKETVKSYKTKHCCDPKIYSFDLAGYGSLQFPERNIFCLAGFSDKVFDIMQVLEKNPHALIDNINGIVIKH